jgi:hypothetical protein
MRRSVTLRRSGVVSSEPLLDALSATERWIRPVCLNHRYGPAADQVLLPDLIPPLRSGFNGVSD